MVRTLLAAAMALGLSATAFAGEKVDVPSVLVVKVQLNKTGVQLQDGAKAIPLSDVQIPRDATGAIDQTGLVKATMPMLDQAEQIDLATTTDVTQAPQSVQSIFQQADQGNDFAHLNWRWWHGWRQDSGFFGYGYNPYWGAYNNVNPYYGYYFNNEVYPFNYGFYYPGSDFGYYYYWY